MSETYKLMKIDLSEMEDEAPIDPDFLLDVIYSACKLVYQEYPGYLAVWEAPDGKTT